MKIICTALLLLGATNAFAQRFDVSVAAGGTWNSPLTTGQSFEPDAGKINALACAELRYHPIPWLSIGAGISVEKLSTAMKIYVSSIDNPGIGVSTTSTFNLGSPALTAYLIAGVRCSFGKYNIAPELIAGYVNAIAATRSTGTYDVNYGKGSGAMAGIQLSATRAMSKKLSLGIRTGVKYYDIEHDNIFNNQSRTISVPFGIVAGIRL